MLASAARMSMAMSPIKRRYLMRISASMALYLVSLIGAKTLIEGHLVSGFATWALALMPGLAVVGMFGAIGRLIVEQTDEFIRMLLVRQNLIAVGFALSVASVWGFLEEFGLVGHVAAYWIVVLWALGSLVGALANRVTHGTWGDCW
jgi:hypothetical protein